MKRSSMEENVKAAKQLSIKLLGRREHSVYEVRAYLVRRGFVDDVIEEVIQWLLSYDYLNDARFAEELIRYRITRSGHGPRKIRWELGQKGVDSHLATRLLDELYSSEEEERQAALAAESWSRRTTKPSDPARLSRYLAGRGFSHETVRRIINERRD
ncbi:MAG: regulatory protein RecX [Limnochordia bacterium]|nr:recombination regulator RecX [Limnochordia bacterium]MDD2628690.1 regulatory protein RecX [Limnochordia bacterium]MDD4517560.1 regulatory protein RecX [Limnochordia bacterium]